MKCNLVKERIEESKKQVIIIQIITYICLFSFIMASIETPWSHLHPLIKIVLTLHLKM
jgi:hypothetical protein